MTFQNSVPLTGTQIELPHPYKKVNLDELTLAQKRDRLRGVAGRILKSERVSRCGRHRLGSIVTISASNSGAMFNGVETCGSIWSCPVCAEKISNKRRLEVAMAIDKTKKLRGGVYMLTLTMQHTPFEKCAELKEAVALSWRRLQNTRAWGRIKEDFQVFGTIRALEITHGSNGWHPHLHIILLTENELEDQKLEEMRIDIFEQWDKKIYSMTGKYCSPEACDLRPTNSSEYLTKGAEKKASKMAWGADKELSKANLKAGKGGASPFELLEYAYHGDRHSVALFAEYAAAFKGARHITWSRGLKDFFGINEISDSTLAENEAEHTPKQDDLPFHQNLEMMEIVALDSGTWTAIGRLHLRPELLDVAYKKGRQGVIELLAKYGLGIYLGETQRGNYRFEETGRVTVQPSTHKPPRLTDMPHSATPWKD